MVEQIISLLLLAGFCLPDIRKKQLSTRGLICALLVALVFRFAEGKLWTGLAGGAEGGVLMLVSRLSGGRFGMGDAVLLAATGLVLGIRRNTELFLTALLLSAVCAAGLLVFRRGGRHYEMPFVPFLTAAQALLLLGGVS
ncbi:MAG: hypothetical protein K2N94_02960 [Lachnospiraceae bacterium]|nr:hypothetical protein [Lachnospiraceae bacterium]